MRNINGGKGRKKKAATRKRKGTPQTKQNAEENPKAGTLRQFVSAMQKEGDPGVPTQTETPRKGKDREEKEDTCTEFRFISAAQEQGKVSSQPVSPYQCALPLNVART
jgi:hypothetical protein